MRDAKLKFLDPSLHGDQQADLGIRIDRYAIPRRWMEAPGPRRFQNYVVARRKSVGWVNETTTLPLEET
jgi:hypothetical protein